MGLSCSRSQGIGDESNQQQLPQQETAAGIQWKTAEKKQQEEEENNHQLIQQPKKEDKGEVVHVVEHASEDPVSLSDRSLLAYIDRNIIGKGEQTLTPFGWKCVTYADWTASGKSLTFIENYLREEVMPLYANTHTTSSVTGLQTSSFRHESRLIARACMGGTEEDQVLFAGSGCTAAIRLFIHVADIIPRIRDLLASPRWKQSDSAANAHPALIIYVGPYEHHSNLLQWRELYRQIPSSDPSTIQVIAIAEDLVVGGVCMKDLEAKLRESVETHQAGTIRIGTFSAGSNVTGILTDTIAVASMLHAYGALACFDYAGAAPYVTIDANPPCLHGDASKDAIFVSPHKFVGGPGCPGVLMVKKRLCVNKIPSTPAGGTVLFVTPDSQHYLDAIEEREEGGTPDILGSIRLGLVFQLKSQVGTKCVDTMERIYAHRTMKRLQQCPWIVLMGHPTAARVCIFSFLVRFQPLKEQTNDFIPDQQFIHPNFISTILNDLFGIQSRSGCMCAGPYAARLLGMNHADILAMGEAIQQGHSLLKPGFVRININWFISTAEVEFMLNAIEFVAQHAWKFMPLYEADPMTGAWKYCPERVTRMPPPSQCEDQAEWGRITKLGQTSKLSSIPITQKTIRQFDVRAAACDNVSNISSSTNLSPSPSSPSSPYSPSSSSSTPPSILSPADVAASYASCLLQSQMWLSYLQSEEVITHLATYHYDPPQDSLASNEFMALKWFLLPSEASRWTAYELAGESKIVWNGKAIKVNDKTNHSHANSTIKPLVYEAAATNMQVHQN